MAIPVAAPSPAPAPAATPAPAPTKTPTPTPTPASTPAFDLNGYLIKEAYAWAPYAANEELNNSVSGVYYWEIFGPGATPDECEIIFSLKSTAVCYVRVYIREIERDTQAESRSIYKWPVYFEYGPPARPRWNSFIEWEFSNPTPYEYLCSNENPRTFHPVSVPYCS